MVLGIADPSGEGVPAGPGPTGADGSGALGGPAEGDLPPAPRPAPRRPVRRRLRRSSVRAHARRLRPPTSLPPPPPPPAQSPQRPPSLRPARDLPLPPPGPAPNPLPGSHRSESTVAFVLTWFSLHMQLFFSLMSAVEVYASCGRVLELVDGAVDALLSSAVGVSGTAQSPLGSSPVVVASCLSSLPQHRRIPWLAFSSR